MPGITVNDFIKCWALMLISFLNMPKQAVGTGYYET